MAATLFAVNKGFMDSGRREEGACLESGPAHPPEDQPRRLAREIEDTKVLDKDAEAELTNAVTAFKKSFRLSPA